MAEPACNICVVIGVAKGENMSDDKSAIIRELNDQFRTTGLGGRVTITRGIFELGQETVSIITKAVRSYDDFSPDNDPYGEHDFGSFELYSHGLYWKIDYYDLTLECGSEDASNPEVTSRVLTIMLKEEY